ncbi:MAG: ABC transporter permease [Defluviitaleaceae bacterium]|nr:ABC transporter permease [Defluviitaleaceae bacterium]
MTIFWYALRRGLTRPVSLALNSILPITFISVANSEAFGTGPEARGYFFVSYVILFGAFMMAGSIQADRIDGVLTRILAGPITFRNYLMQNFFAGLAPMVVLSAILGVIGILRHGWDLPFAGLVVLTYIMLSATSIGLSFVWSCFFKDREASTVAFSLILTLMAFLGGMLIPLSMMPATIRHIGALFPAHWAARAFEELIAYEGATAQYWTSILALALFSAALILYGSKRRIV